MATPQELEINHNEDKNRLLVSDLNRRLSKIHEGGGKARLDKEREKGKMTARERVDYLLDADADKIEIGAFAGDGMYAEHGGCPAGGVVVVMGSIKGKRCIVVANDATVKAGAWFPITGKKNLRAQEIALENHLPIVYLVDSAGVYLPMQDEIFPDKEHFGRIFRNNAKLSAAGILQVAAIMGSCVAGGAYLPIMSDESLIVDKTGTIFLAGSYLVKAAIGEDIDNETLGGATTHCEISGVTDHKAKDDKDALDRIKTIVGGIGVQHNTAGFDRIEPVAPKRDKTDLYRLYPHDRVKPYDVRHIIECLVDGSEYTEFKAEYGKSIVCAYARIDGWSVGIVANQRLMVKSKKEGMQMGGVIYSDSADKSARFIMNCNQKNIPLVFLHDVTGFMVGSRSEHGGIIKDGAKMVNAQANSVVPKFSIVMGNSFGAGNYAMCGKAYDPRLIAGWTTSQVAVMGGAQAAKVLMQIETAARKSKGEVLGAEEESALFDRIKGKYDEQTTPFYAAARLWLDAVIDPCDTRKWISVGLSAAKLGPPTPPYRTGVIQV
jgi:3-methylcrotonyl-CoA carboxylase beta subunit